VADLEAAGVLVDTKPHKLQVPRGDRTGVVIEPMLTDQWFVAMSKPGEDGKSITEKALDVVSSGEISSSPATGSTPTTSGSTTSRTGASRASCGGATRSRPGTASTASASSPIPRKKPARWPTRPATPAR
jgi:hypothetical protein